VRSLPRWVYLLGVQVLTALCSYGGTITVENLEPDTVNVIIRQGGTSKAAADVGAGASYEFNTGNITDDVDCEVRYTYSGSTRTAGTWPEGSTTAQIPSSRFVLRVINNTAVAVTPSFSRNGTTQFQWGSIAAYTTGDSASPHYSDFWYGGPGTWEVFMHDSPFTEANPTAGLASSSYIQGFGAAPGVMIFTFGDASYLVTRCIKNNHSGAATFIWERDSVVARTEYNVPPGHTVCHVYTETAGTSHNYREQVQMVTTTLNEDGSLSLGSDLQTVGTLNNNGGTIGATNSVAGPSLAQGSSFGSIAQSNYLSGGASAPVGFTNVNFGGGASEGSLQAGFNGLITANGANTDRIVGAVTDAKTGIVGAINSLGSNDVVVSVTNLLSLTNSLSVTNFGDTNLANRWDAWSNAGVAVVASIGNGTNYASIETFAEDTGVRADLEAMGFPDGLPVPGPQGSMHSAWVINIMGYTFDLDPVTHPIVGPLLTFLRGCIVYLMLGIYTATIFKRLDEASHQTMLATQTRIPAINVMGNSVGWASSPLLLALVSTTLVAVPSALLVIWQADSNVDGFHSGASTLLNGGTGVVGMALYLAWAVIPFETLFTLLGGWFLVMVQSRTIVWMATFIIRLIPA